MAALFALAAILSGCFPSFEGLNDGTARTEGRDAAADATDISDTTSAEEERSEDEVSDVGEVDDRLDASTDAMAVADADALIDDGSDPCGADLANDPRHCGRCGRDCLSGGCAKGECQAFVFASNANASEMAEDAQYLYWSTKGDNGRVYQMEHGGETDPVLLASDQLNPRGLFVTSERIYWVNQGTAAGTKYFAPTTGSFIDTDLSGKDKHKLDGEDSPMYLARGGDTIYWTAHGSNPNPSSGKPNGAIRACQLVGCIKPWSIIEGQFGPTQIVYNADTLYWATDPANLDGLRGSVWRMKVNPVGSPARLAEGVVQAYGLALDSIDQPFLSFTSPMLRTVTRLPLGTSAPGGRFSFQAIPAQIVVDADYLFWINTGTASQSFPQGSLMRAPRVGLRSDGSTPSGLATFIVANAGPSLIQHGNALYFISGGSIMKMVK